MKYLPGPRADRPRVVVTTDPELDDLNSMLRLLLHANEIDIAGLIYSASQPHHRGNPERNVAPHRWPAPGEPLHIDQAINAYSQAWDNLRIHDPRYPCPDHLRSVTRMGNVDEVGDMREPSPGSDLIVNVLLADDPRPVFLQAWGGLNTIARALMSIEERYQHTTQWENVRERIYTRTVITSFGEQDSTLRDYIRPHWPGLEHREVATLVWGYFARLSAQPDDLELLGAEWMRENVSTVGPMGAAYRVWGDGKQMADGFDAEDYFGLQGLSTEQLTQAGYSVWTPLYEPGAWIGEGDTSNYMLMVDNGLRSWEHPTFGGWGGRQVPDPGGVEGAWTSGLLLMGFPDGSPMPPGLVTDFAPDGTAPFDYHAARWLRPFQQELAARLRWSVAQRYEDANHAPVLSVDEGLALEARAGGSVRLTGRAIDPDGDEVSLSWWVYQEVGTCPVAVGLEDDGAGGAVVSVPPGAPVGSTIHVILEGTDVGTPPMTRYQRCILTVC